MTTEPQAPWANVWTDDAVVHLVPIEDIVWHEFSDSCVCGPDSEPHRPQAAGPDVWYVIHHALDGRP
ncbi:hypothetical protein [Amycolatopsis sp. NPDC001319]|uniref:hypothetical protein n=1 Tax=unclassified Amycolatopsis TaxID=2618356 RepID=UPI0036BB830A